MSNFRLWRSLSLIFDDLGEEFSELSSGGKLGCFCFSICIFICFCKASLCRSYRLDFLALGRVNCYLADWALSVGLFSSIFEELGSAKVGFFSSTICYTAATWLPKVLEKWDGFMVLRGTGILMYDFLEVSPDWELDCYSVCGEPVRLMFLLKRASELFAFCVLMFIR